MLLSESVIWSNRTEEVLRQLPCAINAILDTRSYKAQRNSTIGEKCVDIFRTTNAKNRVLSIWSKVRTHTATVLIARELVDSLRSKIELPPDEDIKPGMYPGWRCFQHVNVDKIEEILRNLP